MFAKLLKHELRNSSGLLTVLNLSGLGAAILGGVILRATVIYGERIHELALLSIIGTLFFIVLGMIGCYVASIVMLLVRYYKSKFTDQGYLTFTLPVNTLCTIKYTDNPQKNTI